MQVHLMPYFHFLSIYTQKASTWNDSSIYTFMSPNRKYFLTVGNECIENIGNSCCRVTCFLSSCVDESSNLMTTNNISHPFTDLTPYLNTEHRIIGPVSVFIASQSVFSQYGNSDYLCKLSMIPALSYLWYTSSECHFFCKNEMPLSSWSLIVTYMNGRS